MPAGEEVDHGEPMANKRRTHPTAERARSHLEKCLARRERLAVQGPPVQVSGSYSFRNHDHCEAQGVFRNHDHWQSKVYIYIVVCVFLGHSVHPMSE